MAQRGGMFHGSADDPAINYRTDAADNVVAAFNEKLRDGSATLTFEGRSGYLRSALAGLSLPVDSQVLVFSPTSFQAKRISATNPRALFFTDRLALGWVRDGDVIEVAAHDPKQGVVFYTLEQKPAAAPRFERVLTCLGCHMVGDTLGVPGLLMFSTASATDTLGFTVARATDHRSALDERWGGWYVTGTSGANQHMGNGATTLAGKPTRNVASVEGLFDADGYRSLSSDIAALMVLSHQVHMTNLLTRAGWEARAADPALHPQFVAAPGQNEAVIAMMRGIASEVVDYLLLVDEAPLADAVKGSTGFAERFSSEGPRDGEGRSLHELDLTRRLLKYPCSYLIYSPAFDALPTVAKDSIYQRMWQVLSGEEQGERYQKALSFEDRQADTQILIDTKPDLPKYFQGNIR